MRSIVILEDMLARLGSQDACAACRISHFCVGTEATHVVGAANGVVKCYPSLTTGEHEPMVMTHNLHPMTRVKLILLPSVLESVMSHCLSCPVTMVMQ